MAMKVRSKKTISSPASFTMNTSWSWKSRGLIVCTIASMPDTA